MASARRAIGYLRDTRTKELIKVGVVAIPVTLLDHAQPLWLVIARLGKGREPWYLLTAEPIHTLADAWAMVLAYARRWQIELVWRYSKSELAFESPRVWDWDVRLKLLLLATLAYAFLLHLLDSSFDAAARLGATELVPPHREALPGGGGAALSVALGSQPALASGATTRLPSTCVKFGMIMTEKCKVPCCRRRGTPNRVSPQ